MAVNAWNEDAKTLNTFAKRQKVPYPILLEGSSVADDWGVSALPTNFLLNSDGKVMKEWGIIDSSDMPKVEKTIEGLLE